MSMLERLAGPAVDQLKIPADAPSVSDWLQQHGLGSVTADLQDWDLETLLSIALQYSTADWKEEFATMKAPDRAKLFRVAQQTAQQYSTVVPATE